MRATSLRPHLRGALYTAVWDPEDVAPVSAPNPAAAASNAYERGQLQTVSTSELSQWLAEAGAGAGAPGGGGPQQHRVVLLDVREPHECTATG